MNVALLLLGYTYRPFITPLPVWDWWFLLLLPLSAAVAVVYKAMKCKSMSQVPREAGIITVWILLAMVGAAVILWGFVRLMER